MSCQQHSRPSHVSRDVSGSRWAHALPMLCRNWRTRKGRMTVASGSKAKVVDSPTDNITCPHGDLLPESAGTRARRISLPRDLWGFLRGSWQAAELKRAQEAAEAATEAATAAETAAVARQADLLEGAPADRPNGWVWPSDDASGMWDSWSSEDSCDCP